MDYTFDLDEARRFDRQDELAHFRKRFVVDDPDLIYLDGNSLGRLPKATQAHMKALIDQAWGQQLIRGWNLDWMEAAERIGGKLARLLGAHTDEVVLADSTSVNLFKLAYAALHALPERHKIVTDDLNFPSDHYILQQLTRMMGRPIELCVVPSPDGVYGPSEELILAIDEDTALVTLSHTVFKTSFTYDMQAITERAEQVGALTLWDISHSVGAMPIELNDCGVPLAVGCTYKHLNGGPGSPAFLYVSRQWQDKLVNPISGWMGQRNVFDFELQYDAAPGIRHFLTGTPFVLSQAAVEPAVDMFIEAGMDRVRAKAQRQSRYLVALWEAWLKPLGFRLNSPREMEQRGSHVSLGHDEGLRVDLALIHDQQVIPDFRPPDNIRFGVTPLYTTFEEVYEAMKRLRLVVSEKLYEKYTDAPAVT